MRVGILGGGQLGWMTILEGRKLCFEFLVLDKNPNSPASRIADRWFPPEKVEEFRELCDVITAEFEHVEEEVLEKVSEKMRPGAELILMKRSRVEEKKTLFRLGYPLPRFVWGTGSELKEMVNLIGPPVVVKRDSMGYDGKGQWRVSSVKEVKGLGEDEKFVVEEFVDFEAEVSVIGVRDMWGNIRTFPLTENHHSDGILLHNRTRTTPEVEREAMELVKSLMEDLKVVGLLAVELFLTRNGKLLINEVAPRPHNTGHYTLDGTETSQFENLLRAVCGLPLGSTRLKTPAGMVNILGLDLEDFSPEEILKVEGAKLYWYGKEKRPRRKMGHVNVVGRSEEEVSVKIKKVLSLLYPKETKKS